MLSIMYFKCIGTEIDMFVSCYSENILISDWPSKDFGVEFEKQRILNIFQRYIRRIYLLGNDKMESYSKYIVRHNFWSTCDSFSSERRYISNPNHPCSTASLRLGLLLLHGPQHRSRKEGSIEFRRSTLTTLRDGLMCLPIDWFFMAKH